MPLGLFHYELLYRTLESIHFIYDEEELANTLLASISQALNAEAGSIFTVRSDQSIFPLASYGASVDALRKSSFAVGKGVVGWVAQYGQPVKVDKPGFDQRFTGGVDNSTGFKTTSILAAPILSKGAVVGVIEFLNRKGGPFAAPDLELISMIGREIGIAFENVRLITKLEHNRAFQESILDSLTAGVIVMDQNGGVIRQNPAAARILGLTQAQVDPAPAHVVFAAHPQLVAVLADISKAPVAQSRKQFNMTINGRQIVIGYSSVPIIDKTGARLGAALLFQDITAFAA